MEQRYETRLRYQSGRSTFRNRSFVLQSQIGLVLNGTKKSNFSIVKSGFRLSKRNATQNSRSQIVFRTDNFQKLSLGAPDLPSDRKAVYADAQPAGQAFEREGEGNQGLTPATQARKCSVKLARKIFASVRLVLTCVDKALHGLTSDFFL